MFGDWENKNDGWEPLITYVKVDGVDVPLPSPILNYSTIGATLNQNSLKVTIPNEIYLHDGWWQQIMRVYIQDQAGG